MTAQAQNITPEFKKAAVEVARHYGIAEVESWEQLPEGFRKFLHVVSYKDLVAPLVHRDRCDLSWQQLSTRYSLSVREVRTICQKAYYRARIQRRK